MTPLPSLRRHAKAFRAVGQHAHGKLERLLAHGLSPNLSSAQAGTTLLESAWRRQDMAACDILLRAGAQVGWGMALKAAHTLSWDPTHPLLQRFLDGARHRPLTSGRSAYGLDPWSVLKDIERSGSTTLATALTYGLQQGMPPDNQEGWSPLLFSAVLNEHAAAVDLLLEAGAPLHDGVGPYRRSALHMAAEQHIPWAITRLIDAGADPKERLKGGHEGRLGGSLLASTLLRFDPSDQFTKTELLEPGTPDWQSCVDTQRLIVAAGGGSWDEPAGDQADYEGSLGACRDAWAPFFADFWAAEGAAMSLNARLPPPFGTPKPRRL